VIAAGALYALDHMVDRLAEDHALARRLAEGLAAIPGITLDLASVETNIVVFSVSQSGRSPMAVLDALAARGVLASEFDRSLVRMVTHYGIEAPHIEATLAATRAVFRES
jgi:threonine aldolase